MNKQEQIKEMKKIIGNVKPFYVETIVEALYNAGYRKIPDGTVVLTNEEYDKLGLFEETVQEYKATNGQLVLVKEQKKLQKYSTDIADFIRKKTAKEILLLLGKGYDETEKTEFNNLQWYKEFCRELKHRYGVEVEE